MKKKITKKSYKKLKEKTFILKDKDSGYDKEIVLKTFELPNGMTEKIFIDKGKNSVCIIAFTKNKEFILVEQYRPSLEEMSLEIPGGGVEENEDNKKAAKRELLEETGYNSNKLELLGRKNYGMYNIGYRECYVAFDCEKKQDLDLDPNEFLEVKIISFDKVRDLIKEDKLRGSDFIYMALDKYSML